MNTIKLSKKPGLVERITIRSRKPEKRAQLGILLRAILIEMMNFDEEPSILKDFGSANLLFFEPDQFNISFSASPFKKQIKELCLGYGWRVHNITKDLFIITKPA